MIIEYRVPILFTPVANIRNRAGSKQQIHAIALLAKKHASVTGQSLVASTTIVETLSKMSKEEKTCCSYSTSYVFSYVRA